MRTARHLPTTVRQLPALDIRRVLQHAPTELRLAEASGDGAVPRLLHGRQGCSRAW